MSDGWTNEFTEMPGIRCPSMYMVARQLPVPVCEIPPMPYSFNASRRIRNPGTLASNDDVRSGWRRSISSAVIKICVPVEPRRSRKRCSGSRGLPAVAPRLFSAPMSKYLLLFCQYRHRVPSAVDRARLCSERPTPGLAFPLEVLGASSGQSLPLFVLSQTHSPSVRQCVD